MQKDLKLVNEIISAGRMVQLKRDRKRNNFLMLSVAHFRP